MTFNWNEQLKVRETDFGSETRGQAVVRRGVTSLNTWVIHLCKQAKKKLSGLTRDHEALFDFVERNKQICTEKEKQKVGRAAPLHRRASPCPGGAKGRKG